MLLRDPDPFPLRNGTSLLVIFIKPHILQATIMLVGFSQVGSSNNLFMWTPTKDKLHDEYCLPSNARFSVLYSIIITI